ncbi:MAG: bacteriohemerythrin [Desulfuromusa sp.]|jgi:methyl-accepting chemotaxis protein|nr:bacteriohemerythrin [Desulfuromusa sp.]
MFNNLKIGIKMVLLSGTILIMLLAIFLWGIFGLSKTASNGIEVSDGNKMRSEMINLENKHLKWAHTVRDFLDDPAITELKAKLDHKTCTLGTWYYGEGRQHAEKILPEIKVDLQALEEPHRLLHASGAKIKAAYSPFSPVNAEAKAIYKNETTLHLKKVGELLVKIAETSKQQIMSDGEMIATANNTRTGVTILGIFALLIGTTLAFFITRSMTAPMKKTVKMIEDIENGHLDTRLQMQRKDEIGQLADSMDRLADSLQYEMVDSLKKLANGDLTFDIQPRDERDQVRGSLKKLGEDLNQIMLQIQTASDQIASGSSQVSESAQSLSDGAAHSAASVEEISSSMNEIGSQTNTSTEYAQQANQLSKSASASANTGSERMTEMIGAMSEINSAGQDIGKIIKVIDEIAFQTNLLALNAAVEAARAGQHGKGFAVVAEEVRNLAARSAKAASETAELIEGSIQKASNGTQIAERTAGALEEIVGSISNVSDLIEEIAAASNEQAQGISQVNIGMQQIDQVIQQNTASSEESAATSEELSSQAAELKHQLSRFKLKGSYGQNYSPTPQLSLSSHNNTAGWGQMNTQPQQQNSSQMFQWKDEYNTGVTLMDQQHRRLVDLINQLFQCMKDGGDRMLLGEVVDELVSYTVTHFRAEEEMMRKHKYPDFAAHQQIHKNFVEKVGAYAEKLKSGERLPPADIYNFLKDWLISHIEKQDRDGYGKYLQ